MCDVYKEQRASKRRSFHPLVRAMWEERQKKRRAYVHYMLYVCACAIANKRRERQISGRVRGRCLSVCYALLFLCARAGAVFLSAVGSARGVTGSFYVNFSCTYVYAG